MMNLIYNTTLDSDEVSFTRFTRVDSIHEARSSLVYFIRNRIFSMCGYKKEE